MVSCEEVILIIISKKKVKLHMCISYCSGKKFFFCDAICLRDKLYKQCRIRGLAFDSSDDICITDKKQIKCWIAEGEVESMSDRRVFTITTFSILGRISWKHTITHGAQDCTLTYILYGILRLNHSLRQLWVSSLIMMVFQEVLPV